MAGGDDKFADHARAVAIELLGEPNKALSGQHELRFGKQGSVSVDLTKGTFFDHSENHGGGVLWAIQQWAGVKIAGGGAVQWMRDRGFDVEDNRPPPPRQQGATSRTDDAGNWLPPAVGDGGRLTKTYDYRDADGRLSYQVCRYDWPDASNPKGHSKTFLQRIPDERKAGGWSYKVKDKITPVPYRLPELLADIAAGYPVFLCYSPDTEVLTPGGWVAFPNLSDGDTVAQWDMETGKISFVAPKARQRFAYDGDLISIKSSNSDLLVTPDHRQPVFYESGCRQYGPMVVQAEKVRWGHALPMSGILDGGAFGPSDDEARLIAAWIADGCEKREGRRVYWNLKKDRKKDRLRNLLSRLGISWSEREYPSTPGWTSFWAQKDDLKFVFAASPGKSWSWDAISWPISARRAAIEEIAFWDGDQLGDSRRMFTGSRQSADVVSAMAAITGSRAVIRTDRRAGRNDNYVVNIRDRQWCKLSMTPARVPYSGEVFCCTVETGFIVVRRNGKISISGNCEGEKKVDMLREIGVPATCNHGGAGKFPEALVDYFAGADVILIPDNDDAGRKHCEVVGRKLEGTAQRLRVLEIPGLPPKGSVDDWLPAGGSAEALYDLVDAAAKTFVGQPYESRFGAVTWDRIDDPGQTYEYLIKGLLTRRELSMLLGESQSGKSFIAIDLAMAVARGVDFFGLRTYQGGVIYQAGESATGVRRKRLPAYRRYYEVSRDPLPFVLLQKPLDLYTSDDDTEAFIEECRHWARSFGKIPLELIIVDTFNKATPGANENDGKDMGQVLARCDRIRRETGAAVMLVHHLNSGGTKARGHTSLFANVENVITVKKVEDASDGDDRQIREWKIAKQKDGEDRVTRRFVLKAVQIGQDDDGDPITSCVVMPPGGQTLEERFPDGIGLGATNQLFLRSLYEAIQTKGVLAPADLGLARGAIAVTREELWAVVKGVMGDDPEDIRPEESVETAARRRDAARRQAGKRARDYLYSKGIIGQNEGWVWLTGKVKVKGFDNPPGLGEASEKSAYSKPARRKRGADGAPPPMELPPDREPVDLPFDVGDFR